MSMTIFRNRVGAREEDLRQKKINDLLNTIDFAELPEEGEPQVAKVTPESTPQPSDEEIARSIQFKPVVDQIISEPLPQQISETQSDYLDLGTTDFYIFKNLCSMEIDRPSENVISHVRIYDAQGNSLYQGEFDQAVSEFFTLSPEEVAGVFGSGEAGFESGMKALGVLMEQDSSGKIAELLLENSALRAGVLAYAGEIPAPAVAMAG